jgi:hypothetical protein
VLDLIFSNEEEMVSDIVIEFPAGKSDHSVISFQFNAYITETPIEKKKRTIKVITTK